MKISSFFYATKKTSPEGEALKGDCHHVRETEHQSILSTVRMAWHPFVT